MAGSVTPRPNPRAVRMLALMLDSERARADAAVWIKPGDWPDQGARRVAAIVMDGGNLKTATPEDDALERAYWCAIARCPRDTGDAIAEMLAQREMTFAFGRELQMLADRFMGGKVATISQAFQETIDAARAIRAVDFASTARLAAEGSKFARRTTDDDGRSSEVAA